VGAEEGDWMLGYPDEAFETSMVQQMCNLGTLVAKELVLVVVPLEVRDGTGIPVRPIALVM
jgi:kynurenine formamidase